MEISLGAEERKFGVANGKKISSDGNLWKESFKWGYRWEPKSEGFGVVNGEKISSDGN